MAVEPESTGGQVGEPGLPGPARPQRWEPQGIQGLRVTVIEEIPDLSRHKGPLHPFVEAEIMGFARYIEGVKAEAEKDPNGDAAKRVARFRERRSEANAAGTPFGIGEILGAFAEPLETDQDSTT